METLRTSSQCRLVDVISLSCAVLTVTLQIMLLRDVFQVPRNDPRVQEAALAIIERCFESTKHMGMAVEWVISPSFTCDQASDTNTPSLTWPVIIAGCQITGPERLWVAETFEGFRKQCKLRFLRYGRRLI